MADGSRSPKRDQRAFHFPALTATCRLRPGEIVVDLFAGGGGASTAIEHALGHPVDIAINHNPWAVSLHAANHPYTRHLCQDVWEADPRTECGGQPVGHLHMSPDCTHFSQAKGGQPRSRATRSLSWVGLRWAGGVRPRIITLENVRQILKWGPLVAKRDAVTGRVVKLDGSIAAPGERVPVDQQFLIPDKRHEGRTWRHFVAALRSLGYALEWRVLRACDYEAAGLLAGTSRERLFLVARCDGEPIRWPEPTRGPCRAKPYVNAADCIDFTDTGRSIFNRPRPLADATMRRIARGVKRYVLDAAKPFIVGVGGRMGQTLERPVSEPMQTITAKADACICTPVLVQCANASADGIARADAPLSTITAQPKGGSHAIVAPVLVQAGYGEREGQAPRCLDIEQPLGTVTAGGVKHALAAATLIKFRGNSDGASVGEPLPTITSGAGAARPVGAAHAMGVITAFIEQANGGFAADGAGHDAREPLSTITATGSQQRLVTAHLVTNTTGHAGAAADEPVPTITSTGNQAVVQCTLSAEHEAGALRVAAFLISYYGTGQALDLHEPMDTITTRDRLALVTVHVHGVPYVIVDIHLRMLRPDELFRAQGFPADYIIDRTADGRAVSTSRAVAMVGNSVSPPPLAAILEANFDTAQEALAA